jgi:hypothetical protein
MKTSPHIQGLYYKLIGSRNMLIADIKLFSVQPSGEVSGFSKSLASILEKVSSLDAQIEVLVKLFPELRAGSEPKVEPKAEPKAEPKVEQSAPPTVNLPNIKPAAMEPTDLYKDGSVLSKFK